MYILQVCTLVCLVQLQVFAATSVKHAQSIDSKGIPTVEVTFDQMLLAESVHVAPGVRRILKCSFQDARFKRAKIVEAISSCGCFAPDNLESVVIDAEGGFVIPFYYIAPRQRGLHEINLKLKYSLNNKAHFIDYKIDVKVENWAQLHTARSNHLTINLKTNDYAIVSAAFPIELALDKIDLSVDGKFDISEIEEMTNESRGVKAWTVKWLGPSGSFYGKRYFFGQLSYKGKSSDPWLNDPVEFKLLVKNNSKQDLLSGVMILRGSDLIELSEVKGLKSADMVNGGAQLIVKDSALSAWSELIHFDLDRKSGIVKFSLKKGGLSKNPLPNFNDVFHVVIKKSDNASYYHPVFYFP